ncbi:MAG: hypothetical protein A3G45_02795 [Candidatus Staskawiczbacteria bacterium RIFCSPLOWO2_12_FULL_37_15]|uniref:Uncharacterized protein n=1 Tax=Candidatus Staskawiczbacteria bacterium RIFCSPLOWO2_12_FULL_37_15 TaxID=1802218 RepID=A0A1G2IL29_9BACT|nr:MAG: hypothetical protein A3G45_02795 [Candidatus Staskawiczbacteria bacterium RIFCSPLOWO2_12_FULL_37_15]
MRQILNFARTFFEKTLNARAGKKEGGWGEGILRRGSGQVFCPPSLSLLLFSPPQFFRANEVGTPPKSILPY